MGTPIQIGIDICSVRRMERAIARGGVRFLNRIFTRREQEYCSRKRTKYENYAARFAAKEAVYKAVGNTELNWKDIKILNDKDGKPFCVINDKKFKNRILISISHTHHYAVASAVVTQ